MISLAMQIPQPSARPTKNAKRRWQNPRPNSSFNGYGIYNFLKLQWEAQNPGATHEEHQAAMGRISRKCGV